MRVIFAVIFLVLAGHSMGQKVLKCQEDIQDPNKCVFNSVEIKSGEDIVLSAENSTENSIETVDFKSSKLQSIPPQLFETFVNLKNLWIVGHKLETIEPNTFENATSLKNLYLNYHEMKNLERDSFEGANNLSMMHICCGALMEINSSAFNGLTELEILILGRNKIQSIEPGTFDVLVKLSKLYLDYNQIEKLHPDTFKQVVNLHWIKLNGNRLEVLPKNLFINNGKLDTIELQDNRLGLVPSDIFSHLTNLNQLFLSSNECVDLNLEVNAINKTQEIEKSLENCTPTFYKYVKLTSKLDQLLEENKVIRESLSAIATDVKDIKENAGISTSREAKTAECTPRPSDFDCLNDLGDKIRTLQNKICYIA